MWLNDLKVQELNVDGKSYGEESSNQRVDECSFRRLSRRKEGQKGSKNMLNGFSPLCLNGTYILPSPLRAQNHISFVFEIKIF